MTLLAFNQCLVLLDLSSQCVLVTRSRAGDEAFYKEANTAFSGMNASFMTIPLDLVTHPLVLVQLTRLVLTHLFLTQLHLLLLLTTTLVRVWRQAKLKSLGTSGSAGLQPDGILNRESHCNCTFQST